MKKKTTAPDWMRTECEKYLAGAHADLRGEDFKPDTKPPANDKALSSTVAEVKAIIQSLYDHAYSGDELAARALVSIASAATMDVCALAKRKPEILRGCAEKNSLFPVMASPHLDSLKQVKSLVESLDVGKTSVRKVRGRWRFISTNGQPFAPTLDKFCNRMLEVIRAARVYDGIQIIQWDRAGLPIPEWMKQAQKLPELTCKNSAKKWFAVGWDALLEATGGRPETIPELHEIGKHREQFWKREGASEKVQKSQARAAIKARLSVFFMASIKYNSAPKSV